MSDGIHGTDGANGAGVNPIMLTAQSAYTAGRRNAFKEKRLPFVEPYELDLAKQAVQDEFMKLTGKPFDFRPAGYMIALKIFIRPEEIKVIKDVHGEMKTLWLHHKTVAEDKYQQVAALVCAMGPQAYKGKNADGTERFPEGPWVTEASWVVIPRYESFLFMYRGVAMALIPDDKIMGVIEDPMDVSPINQSDRI